MRKRKKSYPAVQFGTSLMLVVFITLCLTVFATLSLSGAMRDYDYSRRAADKTYDYYQADAKANEKLAEIMDSGATDARVSYRIPVNDSQELLVTLVLYTPDTTGERLYRIAEWKEVASQDWNSATTLPVIGSD